MRLMMVIVSAFAALCGMSQQIHYSGSTLANPSRHDGALAPLVGVHNIQTMHANRTPDPYNPDSVGWTYNHQPMIAWWQGKFYMHYLSNPAEEHVGAGRTMMQISADGYSWSKPVVLFPVCDVPDGFTKDSVYFAKDTKAVMHQRVGWYVSADGRLLATGNYGIAMHRKDDPNDGNGIGRVVREIYADGSMGPVYFIYYNHGFNEKNTSFPYYTRSKDKGFIQACREMIDNPLWRMQWVEEADRNDPLIPLPNPYKAMCWYTLPDGCIAALWKHALTAQSDDGGHTWSAPVQRARGFVNSNAKIWGQRLADGTYATVYNPAEFRWPLALSVSADGIDYKTLHLVQGEVPPMRYGGQYKSYGPQYVRGIQEGNGTPADSNLWVAYSMNKEDMWVARVPVPVRMAVTAHADDDFTACSCLADLEEWGIHSPLLAPVSLIRKDGTTWLTLSDGDPHDRAVAERIIPASDILSVEFDLQAAQNNHGTLQISLLDNKGTACARFDLDAEGLMKSKGGARYGRVIDYEADRTYHVKIDVSVTDRQSTVYIDSVKRSTRMLFAPVEAVTRIRFATGEPSAIPDIDTPADVYADLPDADATLPTAVYRIARLRTSQAEPSAYLLGEKAPIHEYVQYFNAMEDENIVQAIPNSMAEEWMVRNIPVFLCPDKDFEQMYYFRWWSLRKHIKEIPGDQGNPSYGMTEFLVDRKYADKYNLISCALGHHIYESRWLRDPAYLDGIINTWYRGNDGAPMERMMNFSSWNPDAVYNRFKATGDTTFIAEYYPDLRDEYMRWEQTHRLDSGLYGQRDVSDGMEESISGARKHYHARPTINSYMYGNAEALCRMATMLGNTADSAMFAEKAMRLRSLVCDSLWCADDSFFETMLTDSIHRPARVREAIGFLPWYFNLPDSDMYAKAWLQLTDPKGFSAPYGITTAERRHPAFRSHGTGKCEWDGAVWPFATSQTLTALANYFNSTSSPVIDESVFAEQMKLYVESQHHRGRPYIGEYLDETTGYWLKGDQERSRYYNHSTFADLVITGIAGLRPRADGVVELHPLAPKEWKWWCVDKIPYHGQLLTIIYDEDGTRFYQGKGLTVLCDGRCMPPGHGPGCQVPASGRPD